MAGYALGKIFGSKELSRIVVGSDGNRRWSGWARPGGLLGGAKKAGGGGGFGSLLDMSGDGNALDDVLKLAGKALR